MGVVQGSGALFGKHSCCPPSFTGVLRDINNVISIANIASQHLQTNSSVGYVVEVLRRSIAVWAVTRLPDGCLPACSYLVVDLETNQLDVVREKLNEVEHNIRMRLLYRGKGYKGFEPINTSS